MNVLFNSHKPMISFYVGTGGILKGQLAMVSSSTAIDATEGQSTAVIIGIANDDYDAGVVGQFTDIDGAIIEMPIYQGGSTDTFADSDIGKAFDINVTSEVFSLDPNDTSGAMFVLQSYNNDNATCTAKIVKALLYLA